MIYISLYPYILIHPIPPFCAYPTETTPCNRRLVPRSVGKRGRRRVESDFYGWLQHRTGWPQAGAGKPFPRSAKLAEQIMTPGGRRRYAKSIIFKRWEHAKITIVRLCILS